MATEPREAGDNAESEKPAPPIRHQQGRLKAPKDDAGADDAASQQQQ